MAPKIRVVESDGEPADVTLEEAAQSLLRRVLSEGANIVVIAWETDKGASVESIPKSYAVVRGVVDTLYEQIHVEDVVE